jgi:hypothetical protein
LTLLFEAGDRTGLKIPDGVTSESLMQTLKLGHGYRWRILVKDPAIIAHGATVHGNMPEVLLLGGRTLVIAGGDSAYAARIETVLAMLNRQSQRIQQSIRGESHG